MDIGRVGDDGPASITIRGLGEGSGSGMRQMEVRFIEVGLRSHRFTFELGLRESGIGLRPV